VTVQGGHLLGIEHTPGGVVVLDLAGALGVYTNRDAASGTTFELPIASAGGVGTRYEILVATGGQAVTVDAASGATIDSGDAITAPGGAIAASGAGSSALVTQVASGSWIAQLAGPWDTDGVPPTPPGQIASRTVAATGAVLVTDDLILVDTSGGVVTLTLPTAVGWLSTRNTGGRPEHLRIKVIDATNDTNIATTGGQTIDGGASPLILRKNHLTAIGLVSDGSDWGLI